MKTETRELTIRKGHEVRKAAPALALTAFEEMERLFDRLFPRGWMRPFRWEPLTWHEMAPLFEGGLPKIDVIDRDSDIVVRAEIPGVEKKDLEVSLTENLLTIKGRTGHEVKEEKGDYYRCEMSRGEFTRTVALPAPVLGDKAKAELKDGVLELTLPKVEESKRLAIKVQ